MFLAKPYEKNTQKKESKKKMKPNIIEKHNGCPNQTHCSHNDEKCCYLNHEKQCIINQNKIKRERKPYDKKQTRTKPMQIHANQIQLDTKRLRPKIPHRRNTRKHQHRRHKQPMHQTTKKIPTNKNLTS